MALANYFLIVIFIGSFFLSSCERKLITFDQKKQIAQSRYINLLHSSGLIGIDNAIPEIQYQDQDDILFIYKLENGEIVIIVDRYGEYTGGVMNSKSLSK